MYGPSKLGEMLIQARNSRGLNQHELSKKSGVAQATISQIESGYTQNPSFATLKKLFSALDYDLRVEAVPRK